MMKAIISGANGLVGMSVANYLSSLGIEVLCLGRKILSPTEVSECFGLTSSYLKLDMKDIDSLVDRVESITWSPGSKCVFFNFAWRGDQRLTDGGFSEQFNNAIYAAEAVRSAKKLGCVKFVNTGTLEETFVERSLKEGSGHSYQSTQLDYALAKLASRDMCKMVAYLEKIDYVHTRLSVPLASDLSRGTYVAGTLKKIIDGEPYDKPKNNQLFDFVFTDDVARAYSRIGFKGKNKADYFIGTSRFMTLGQCFEIFERLVSEGHSHEAEINAGGGDINVGIEALYRDTGFVPETQFQDIIKELVSP